MDVLPKMKYNILVLVCLHILGKTLALDVGSCSIPNLDTAGDFINLVDIKDTEPFSTDYEITGNIKVEDAATNDDDSAKYLDVHIQDSKLTIATSANFSHLEEDLANVDTQSLYPIRKSILFTCNDDSKTATLMIKFYVQDTNNHAPTFEQAAFEYKVPSPLIQKIDLTIFGDKIISKDIDLSNNDVTFTTTNPNFQIESQKTEVPKERQAILKVLSLLTFESDIVLDVTATDSGDPPQSSAITITLKKDPDNSVPSIRPQFSKSFYSFDYVETDGVPSITPSEEISIEYTEEVDVTISDVEHVKVNYDPATKKVTLESTGTPIETSSDTVKLLTLTAVDKINSDIKSEAAIAIKLPVENTLTIPTFKSPYYEATYKVNPDDTDTVEDLSSAIEVSEKAQVSLDGDPRFTYDGSGVIVAEDLDLDTLKKGEDIVLILTATVVDDNSNEIKGFATLIVHLPEVKRSPQFTKAHYSAEYKAGDTDVALKEPIDVKSDADTAIIVFSESSPYFDLTKDDTNVWKISPKDGISITEKELVYTLQATIPDGNGDPEESTLIISINTPVPTFSALYYTATYMVGDPDDTVAIDGDIAVEVDPSITITVDLEASSQYSENFHVVPKGSGYDIEVATKLDDKVLIDEPDIVLTLNAQVEETVVATATLVIQLPKEAAPAGFKQEIYQASYIIDKTDADTIKLDQPIELEGKYTEETQVTLKAPDDLDGYFEISKTSPYSFTVITKLTAEYINSHREIILTVDGKLDNSDKKSTAVVVIALPELPTFSNLYYTGLYKVNDDDTAQVLIDEPQIAIGDDPLDITVEKPYDGNFKVSYDTATKVYSISVEKPIEGTDPEIYLVLDATVDSAVLVLRREAQTSDVVPKFSKIFYQGTYTVNADGDDTIKMDVNQINIISDHAENTKVAVIDTFASNFETQQNGNSWDLIVKNKLGNSELSENEIPVSLEASLPGGTQKGTATLILTIAGSNPDNLKAIPLFDKPQYTTEYNVDDPSSTSVVDINIESASADIVEVTFDGYKDNFKITRDKQTASLWHIEVGTPLEESVVKSNSELIIPLTSRLENSIADGNAVLIVTIPKTELNFEKSYYEGSYVKESNEVKIGETITVTEGSDVDLTGEEYKDNFGVSCDDKGVCTLSVTKPLDDAVLNEKTEIILVLEATSATAAIKATATIIISLPLQEALQAPEFDQPVYVTKYYDNNTVNAVQIKLKGDRTGIKLSLSGKYYENFGLADKDDHWEITTTGLSDVILNSEVSIPLTLVAEKDGVTVKGQAGLVIDLPKEKGSTTILQFEEVIYIASYEEKSPDEDALSYVNGPIKIAGVTDLSDATLEITDVSNKDYKEYFDLTPDGDHWTLPLIKDLPRETIEGESAVSLTLSVTIGDLKGETALIVTLPKKFSTASFWFKNTVYVANYNEDGPDLEFESDEGILLTGDLTTPINVKASGDNAEFFNVTVTDDKVDVTLAGALPKEILDKAAITVDLLASKEEEFVSAAVVVKLPIESSSFFFEDNVYFVKYDKNNHTLISGKKIVISGDPDSTAKITIAGDNKDYFKHEYKSSTVTLSVSKPLPDDFKDSTISLTITAKISDADHNEETTAGLVIEVPVTSGGDDDGDDDSSYDKTGLIAAVAVLAVLLVASLVGSAVFYFLKFRRGSNSGTFRKNSNAIITKIDHPKRRPTGVIKLPLENEDVGETTTDGANMEKRKSVQFDTINIDELEIEKAEEVEEHDIVDVETPNNSKGSDIESDTESVKDSDSDQDSNDDDADRRISRV